jgi:hypothetical protein
LIVFPIASQCCCVSTQLGVTADGSWLSVAVLRSRLIAPSLSFRRPSLLCWPSISAKLVTSHKWEVQTAAKVFAFSPQQQQQLQRHTTMSVSLSPHCVCVVYSNWLCSNRNNLINIRSSSSSSYIYNFPGLRRAFARPFDVAPIETFSLSLLVPILYICSGWLTVCVRFLLLYNNIHPPLLNHTQPLALLACLSRRVTRCCYTC